MLWTARASTKITFDFEIEAETKSEVYDRIREYLPYIEHGKLKNQPVSVKVKPEDKLNAVFVMDIKTEDVYE